MFRRRGCMFGCGGFLLLCVIGSLLGWFVVVPKTVDTLQEGVSDAVSTFVADSVSPGYSREELQRGADVPIEFSAINAELASTIQSDSNLDSVEILSRDGHIVMSAKLSGQDYEMKFMPYVTEDGRLHLEPFNGDGWWQEKTSKVLGGGFERSINLWLEENGLVLTGVKADSDVIVLSVIGD